MIFEKSFEKMKWESDRFITYSWKLESKLNNFIILDNRDSRRIVGFDGK